MVAGVGIVGMAVSAGGGEPGADVGGDEGVKVGRNNVGESWGTSSVGSGRTPMASRRLNRKPPNIMPMLISVMARLPSSCPAPVV